MSAAALVGPSLRARLPRILGVAAFATVFLVAGAIMRAFFRDDAGHVEIGRLFEVGGYPLASTLLLLGWLIGRFPLIAAVVLTAGLFSRDRETGYARLYLARPVSAIAVYGLRFLAMAGIAFLLSAILLPGFDLLMLGEWAGPSTFALIGSQVLIYGGLTALFSLWTRGDAWAAVGVAIGALLWEALIRSQVGIPPGPAALIRFVLPPQWAMLQIEEAFGAGAGLPWEALVWAGGYGVVVLGVAGVVVRSREV